MCVAMCPSVWQVQCVCRGVGGIHPTYVHNCTVLRKTYRIAQNLTFLYRKTVSAQNRKFLRKTFEFQQTVQTTAHFGLDLKCRTMLHMAVTVHTCFGRNILEAVQTLFAFVRWWETKVVMLSGRLSTGVQVAAFRCKDRRTLNMKVWPVAKECLAGLQHLSQRMETSQLQTSDYIQRHMCPCLQGVTGSQYLCVLWCVGVFWVSEGVSVRIWVG